LLWLQLDIVLRYKNLVKLYHVLHLIGDYLAFALNFFKMSESFIVHIFVRLVVHMVNHLFVLLRVR
jgi:hypothetical protein